MFHYHKDIHVEAIDLWLDSKRKREFGFISHAHADHIARHSKILCTAPTGKFLEKRLKRPDYRVLNYGEPFHVNDSTIELFPAGHMLGSAQIKISDGSSSLLYTGDFKIDPSRTAEPFDFVEADILIMETTFGTPDYIQPPRHEVEERLIQTCSTLLRQGRVPVVFAYSLGKGQEALKILSDAGLRVAVDYNILKFIPVYQQFGISFNPFEKFKRSEYRDRILLLPPSFRFQKYVRNLPGRHTIFLSGWGGGKGADNRFGVDEVIPLSDHADFRQLMHFVERIRPDRIYCTHGMKSFVNTLNNAGFRAFELGEVPLEMV